MPALSLSKGRIRRARRQIHQPLQNQKRTLKPGLTWLPALQKCERDS
jgi:hypothetical protein